MEEKKSNSKAREELSYVVWEVVNFPSWRSLTISYTSYIEITEGKLLWLWGRKGETGGLQNLCQTFSLQFHNYLCFILAEIKAPQRRTNYPRSHNSLRLGRNLNSSLLSENQCFVCRTKRQQPKFFRTETILLLSVCTVEGLGIMTGLWSTNGIQIV